jgi:oligosaccharide 4-alpha-D-glucosyltransferase
MRPLFFVDNKPELLDEKSAYLWGESFLVSPVVSKGATQQNVYLPTGSNWIDFWTNECFAGGQEIVVPVDINMIPVFVKAGSLIPMAESSQSTKTYDNSKLNIMYYFDPTVKESRGLMYEDDGETKDSYEKKLYEILDFTAVNSEKQTNITVNSTGFDYKGKPAKRIVCLIVPNFDTKPGSVLVNGVKVKIEKSQPDTYPGKPYACWDKLEGKFKVVAEVSSVLNIEIFRK